MQYFYF